MRQLTYMSPLLYCSRHAERGSGHFKRIIARAHLTAGVASRLGRAGRCVRVIRCSQACLVESARSGLALSDRAISPTVQRSKRTCSRTDS